MSGTYGVIISNDPAMTTLAAAEHCRLKTILVRAEAGTLARGAVMALNTNTYQWQSHDPAGTNGVNVARGILAEAIENQAIPCKAQMYCQGVFYQDGLVWPANLTEADRQVAVLSLADKGLHLESAPWSTTTTTTV